MLTFLEDIIRYNSPVTLSGSELLFIGNFLITNSISLLITIVCLYLLFLYDSVLGECMFLGVHPFLLLCAFCGGGSGLVAKLCLTLATP